MRLKYPYIIEHRHPWSLRNFLHRQTIGLANFLCYSLSMNDGGPDRPGLLASVLYRLAWNKLLLQYDGCGICRDHNLVKKPQYILDLIKAQGLPNPDSPEYQKIQQQRGDAFRLAWDKAHKK